MSDVNNIREGFNVLERTDDSRGGVSADRDRIWAGSDQLDYYAYPEDERSRLENHGWHFDDDIERWCLYL